MLLLIAVKIYWIAVTLLAFLILFYNNVLISLEKLFKLISKDHGRINYQGTTPFLAKRWTWDIAQPIRLFLKLGYLMKWDKERKWLNMTYSIPRALNRFFMFLLPIFLYCLDPWTFQGLVFQIFFHFLENFIHILVHQ